MDKCLSCNSELESWQSNELVCSRCGKAICDHCGAIDMSVCLCNSCCDDLEWGNYRCYDCANFTIEDTVVYDYAKCRCEESNCYGETIFYISVEEENSCEHYRVR